mmetsp:Transcript_26881/g.41892  ORF Transcript_26881/g.41892 Transcript_26881/m.41892 type:complete len:173 (+) Transcript_26881:544-1062(+)
MQKLKADGFARFVGVSNFYRQHIEIMKEKCCKEAIPYANEIFVDVTHQERDYVDWMKQEGINIIAYRPLAFLPHMEMALEMGDGTLITLKEKAKGADINTVHQYILAWLLKRGIVPLTKTRSHTEDNLLAASLAQTEIITKDSIADLEGAEMIEMVGGLDEYAAAFKRASEK